MLKPFSCTIDQAADVVGQDKPASVLVVGDDALAQRLGQLLDKAGLDKPLQVVPDCLMALGQVAVDPPSVLIARIEDLDDPIECTSHTLRQLAPNTRLLVLASSSQNADAQRAIASGFDQSILEPIDAQRLREIVQTEQDADICIAKGLVQEVPWLMRQAISNQQDLAEAASDKLDLLDGDQPHHEQPRQLIDQVGPDQISATDMELIEQILHGRDEKAMRQAVLGMIAVRIGSQSVDWSSRLDQVPHDHVSVPVEYGAQRMGHLHAPSPVKSDQLLPWAPWLGRWLALSRHVNRLWHLAMQDETTGLWNRRYFNQFLKAVLDRAADRRFYVSLLVFDIDDFKIYNDRYGHIAGDDILRETARLMQSLVREHDVVARIGGDEFAVIFWGPAGLRRPNSAHPHDPIEVARRFQRAICAARFPKLGHQAPGTLTISGGLAGFPWDGHTPEQLLDLADKMALRSKRQGKNAITIGPGVKRNGTTMSSGS